jgi:hypothetical protein
MPTTRPPSAANVISADEILSPTKYFLPSLSSSETLLNISLDIIYIIS